MRIAVGVLVVMLCLMCFPGCSRRPETERATFEEDMAAFQWFIEPFGRSGWTEFGDYEGPNLLVDSERANDPEVIRVLECVLRYGLVGAPSDSPCFVGLGWDRQGQWLDPPPRLLDDLSDLSVRLVPVSQAGLNALPPSGERGSLSFWQPWLPGPRCTLELTEWDPGSEAVVRFMVVAPRHAPRGGGVATATLSRVDGDWSVQEWSGELPWSPN